MVGTFSIADSSYSTTEIEHAHHYSKNDILELKLEIYQLKEKNIELQKIIDNFKLTKEQRDEYRHQEAILNLKRQLRSGRTNTQISLAF